MIIIMTIKGKSLGNICFKSPGLQRELGEQGVYHFLSKLFHCRFSSRNSGQNVCNKNLQSLLRGCHIHVLLNISGRLSDWVRYLGYVSGDSCQQLSASSASSSAMILTDAKKGGLGGVNALLYCLLSLSPFLAICLPGRLPIFAFWLPPPSHLPRAKQNQWRK